MRQPVPFGKYLLLDRISVGGMAEVFKAKSYGVEGFEKIIAIKRILPTMGEDRDFIKMFIDEAKIAGQLAHANICQIFELGRIDGSHFIAMEYIWGKDLLQIGNRLRKLKRQMPVPTACFVIAKVLEGLDYAHRKRDPLGRPLDIVHRDCSPQNVLVSYEGEVKVIDFGIAKATSRNSRTMAGVLKGKFGYMSPEQVRGLPLDRRSDIFALGTMLFECLTGERLFQGETDFSTLEKVRNVDVQSPRAINPAIPEQIERVIMKALAKDVEDRYQWCSEMLGDLQQYLMSQDVVFTAKSLSSWLKEAFAPDIDKERAQLEQYKRVGRDGLIAGVPAAAAKLDVVESLGEAGMPEGDATQLGGPDFEALEQALAAKASVAPAPKGPASSKIAAAKGPPLARSTPPPQPAQRADGDNDFGEEAATEIFGDQAAADLVTSLPPLAARPQPAPPSIAPPAVPPRPPPRMTGPQASAAPSAPLSGAPSAPLSGGPSGPSGPLSGGPSGPLSGAPVSAGLAPSAPTAMPQGARPDAFGPPPGVATGTPVAATPALAPPNVSSHKTVLGTMSPVAGNYGPGYRVSQQTPAAAYPPSGGYPVAPVQHPSGGYPSAPSQPHMAQPNMGYGQPPQYPSQPQMQGYPSQPQMPAYPSQPSFSGLAPSAPAVDHTHAIEGRRKSSIGRDVAIGVAIAVVVLGGFLGVKFFVLDKKADKPVAAAQSSIALLKVTAASGAELWIDDKKVDFVAGQEVPVTAGHRKIRVVTPAGKCEQELELPGGQSTPFECAPAPEAGSAGSAEGSGAQVAMAGSDAGSNAGSGSATMPEAGSNAGSGSAAAGSNAGSGAGSATAPMAGSNAGSGAGSAAAPMAGSNAGSAAPAIDKSAIDKPAVKPEDKKPLPTVKPEDKKPADKPLPVPAVKPEDKKPVDKKPAEKKPADAKGYLVVATSPPAKVLVDGGDTGLTTPVLGKQLPLSPGKHKITFVTNNVKVSYPIVIKAGASVTMPTKQLE